MVDAYVNMCICCEVKVIATYTLHYVLRALYHYVCSASNLCVMLNPMR